MQSSFTITFVLQLLLTSTLAQAKKGFQLWQGAINRSCHNLTDVWDSTLSPNKDCCVISMFFRDTSPTDNPYIPTCADAMDVYACKDCPEYSEMEIATLWTHENKTMGVSCIGPGCEVGDPVPEGIEVLDMIVNWPPTYYYRWVKNGGGKLFDPDNNEVGSCYPITWKDKNITSCATPPNPSRADASPALRLELAPLLSCTTDIMPDRAPVQLNLGNS
ncbi:hypothetical protein QBC34DRAFT_467300 [Podospora aff. communis PSN243]|uniref:Ig-like domain-containing protein n=1 Tax=Podospora aff. communis PSN243 TaxID=3040156 RepID=A0AAV9GFQ4_9PEZI|nr:hypothetical protein QBC34DRAFT_467300 [Podospora aff. communis PSN243]